MEVLLLLPPSHPAALSLRSTVDVLLLCMCTYKLPGGMSAAGVF